MDFVRFPDLYKRYFNEVAEIAQTLDMDILDKIIDVLWKVKRNKGRVFVLGLGGSAPNASHMVVDLRKICNIHAYAPTDNVAEITARANDESFDNIFSRWLETSNLNSDDCLFILSVSGGNPEVSSNAIAKAIDLAHNRKVHVLGICGDPNGYLAIHGDTVIQIPIVNVAHKYQHAESFQGVIWHFLITHPDLREAK